VRALAKSVSRRTGRRGREAEGEDRRDYRRRDGVALARRHVGARAATARAAAGEAAEPALDDVAGIQASPHPRSRGRDDEARQRRRRARWWQQKALATCRRERDSERQATACAALARRGNCQRHAQAHEWRAACGALVRRVCRLVHASRQRGRGEWRRLRVRVVGGRPRLSVEHQLVRERFAGDCAHGEQLAKQVKVVVVRTAWRIRRRNARRREARGMRAAALRAEAEIRGATARVCADAGAGALRDAPAGRGADDHRLAYSR